MDIKELRTTYGEPYNNAYYEIKILLRKYDFYNTQGSVYLTDKDDMANEISSLLKPWTIYSWIAQRDFRCALKMRMPQGTNKPKRHA